MVFKKAWKAFISTVAGILSTAKSPGPVERPSDADKLEASRHALGVIESITYARTRLLTTEIDRIHKLADDGLDAIKK